MPLRSTTHSPSPSLTSSRPVAGSASPSAGVGAGVGCGAATTSRTEVLERPRRAAVALGERERGEQGRDGHGDEPRARDVRRGGACGVCGEHGPPRALARGYRVGRLRLAQRALELLDLVAGHGRSSARAIASASSARRSRELTVPRGRSSIAAISPGV